MTDVASEQNKGRTMIRITASAIRTSLSGVLAGIISLLVSTLTLAQTTPESTTSGGEGAYQLQDIVVTATRREESVQSVPISISAFGEEELATGAMMPSMTSALTPGLQYAVPNGFSSAR